MAEWSIASDLKSDELNRFREFESHSLLLIYSLVGKMYSFVILDKKLVQKNNSRYNSVVFKRLLFLKNNKI